MSKDEQLDEIVETVTVVLDAVRDSKLIPGRAQWARAHALTEAREVYLPAGVTTGTLCIADVEALALRWARFIETGSFE